MRVLLDTNVLVAAVTRDTDRSPEAIEPLDRVDDPDDLDGALEDAIAHDDPALVEILTDSDPI